MRKYYLIYFSLVSVFISNSFSSEDFNPANLSSSKIRGLSHEVFETKKEKNTEIKAPAKEEVVLEKKDSPKKEGVTKEEKVDETIAQAVIKKEEKIDIPPQEVEEKEEKAFKIIPETITLPQTFKLEQGKVLSKEDLIALFSVVHKKRLDVASLKEVASINIDINDDNKNDRIWIVASHQLSNVYMDKIFILGKLSGQETWSIISDKLSGYDITFQPMRINNKRALIFTVGISGTNNMQEAQIFMFNRLRKKNGGFKVHEILSRGTTFLHVKRHFLEVPFKLTLQFKEKKVKRKRLTIDISRNKEVFIEKGLFDNRGNTLNKNDELIYYVLPSKIETIGDSRISVEQRLSGFSTSDILGYIRSLWQYNLKKEKWEILSDSLVFFPKIK